MRDLLIVGGGPAGITAAIQCARFGRSVTLFEANRIGGMLHEANLVENYPGFPKGIAGHHLANLMTKQLDGSEVEVIQDRVVSLKFHSGMFSLETAGEVTRDGLNLVLATGTLPLPWMPPAKTSGGEKYVVRELAQLADPRDKCIAIIGGGDASFDYALNLAAHNRVMLFTRSSGERALPLLRERVRRHPAIEWHANHSLESMAEVDDGVRFGWRTGSRVWTSEANALLVAIGRKAEEHLLEMVPEPGRTASLREGRLHLVGDMANGMKRQTAVAVGDSMRAALRIEENIVKAGVR